MREGRGRVNRSLFEKVASRKSRSGSSIIVRARLCELIDSVHCRCRIGSFDTDPHLCPFRCGQRHQVHYAFAVDFRSIVADSDIGMKRKHGAHEPRFRPDVMPLFYRDLPFHLLDSIALIGHTTRRRRHVSHDCFNCSAHRFCPPLVEVFLLTRSTSRLAFGKDDVSGLDMPTWHTRISRGTEAPALLRRRGRDGKRLARGAEAACFAAGAQPANPRPRRRNWIFLARTHGQVSSVDRGGPGVSRQCARVITKRGRSRHESARGCGRRAYRTPRWLLTDASRRNSAENLTGISEKNAKRSRQIARLEQQRHSRWDTRWPASTRIDRSSPEGYYVARPAI